MLRPGEILGREIWPGLLTSARRGGVASSHLSDEMSVPEMILVF